MSTDTGENLLEPGSSPEQNMRFIVMMAAVLRAVDLYADILRASIGTAGNDHRLGANEAPPAILSVYLGEQLTEVMEGLISGTNGASRKGGTMQLGVTSMPALPRDATDRNRTSPFAFTGNKFEFRAVGSSQSPSKPMTVLNTIVADSLEHIADEVEKRKSQGLESAVNDVVVEIFKAHQRVVFNGNGYSEDWHKEAAGRGLPNVPNAVDALANFGAEKNVQLFDRLGVLLPKESESRMNIQLEAYSKAIAIEGQSALSIARTMLLPAAQKTQRDVADSLSAAKMHGLATERQSERLGDMTRRIEDFVHCIGELADVFEKCENHEGSEFEQACAYRDEVIPAMNRLREHADQLETMTDDDYWPLPKYRELLFLH